MTPKILWVDDTFANELHDVMAYVDELEDSEDFKVDKIASVDQALDTLEKGEEEFVCIILDIMMPYGNGKRLTRRETEDGTKTGIVLAKEIHKKDKEGKYKYEKYKDVPIVLLTGVYDIHASYIKNNIGIPCFVKGKISAEEFLKKIQEEIKKRGGGNHV